MKNALKKTAVVLMILATVMAAFSLVACTNTGTSSKNSYTVKVVGPDGNPYTKALVQPCLVEANGELSTCYQGVATDSEGVAVLEIGKQIEYTKADLIEVHLLGLPSYLTYEAPRIRKGSSITITLKENIATPESGTGVGEYESPGRIDSSSFSPYVVGEGAYRFKFTSADQNIYFVFKAEYEAVYRVFSVGSVDASVTQLTGTAMTGIWNGGDENFHNDNISDTDKNFSYEFEVSPSLLKQDEGKCYFEIALENAEHVNRDAIICFEYVDEYEEDKTPDVTDVTPATALDTYPDEDGTFVYVNLYEADTGDFVYVMGDDGYYHVGEKTGPVLVASLGQDSELNANHAGNGYAPRCYDIGFTLQYREKSQSLTVSDGKTYAKNYYPLVEAYTKASNSRGRYGVTEELKNFLDAYINQISGTKLWVETNPESALGHLPDGKEWLWACGYYEPPYELTEDDFTVEVSEKEETFYYIFVFKPSTVTVTSDSTNAKLSAFDPLARGDAVNASAGVSGLTLEVEIGARGYFLFVFSTIDGKADSYSVNVSVYTEPDPEGSFENPKKIDAAGFVSGETLEDGAVYYSYTVSKDCTLYITAGDNTYLCVSYTDENGDDQMKWFTADNDDLSGGLTLKEGTVLKIEATKSGTVNSISFTITESTTEE